MLPICWFNFASLKWIKLIGLVYGMPLAPVRLWSSCGAFLFLLVLCPSGTHEILGTKVDSIGQHQGTPWLLAWSFAGSLPHFVFKMGIPTKLLTNSLAYDPSLDCLAVVQRIVYTRKGGR